MCSWQELLSSVAIDKILKVIMEIEFQENALAGIIQNPGGKKKNFRRA